jgi:hypothetical protein
LFSGTSSSTTTHSFYSAGGTIRSGSTWPCVLCSFDLKLPLVLLLLQQGLALLLTLLLLLCRLPLLLLLLLLLQQLLHLLQGLLQSWPQRLQLLLLQPHLLHLASLQLARHGVKVHNIFRLQQCIHGTRLPGARSAACTMHVRLGVHRRVIVYHVCYAGYVHASSHGI